MLFAVLTTIQKPTPSVLRLAETLRPLGAELIVAGDRKGPNEFQAPVARFLSLEDQFDTGFELARKLPTGHYARKNIAYLMAIRNGAGCIYETDDDNAPNAKWAVRTRSAVARRCTPRDWANVYRMFSDEKIWPRGFPLERITDPTTYELAADMPIENFDAPIHQGLANGSPDVDAVWRLTSGRDFQFDERSSVWLPPGTWCPFNSQTTWWWPPAFPLLYLPSYCSFRMTDIWRSFVAQRCLWETGCGLIFHPPEVDQARNEHALLKDFEDEIPGYLDNQKIVSILTALELRSGPDDVSTNLLRCYEALMRAGIIPGKEMELLEAWVADLTLCASSERMSAASTGPMRMGARATLA